VLLARRVTEELKGRIFDKPSIRGSWGPKVYKISGRHTKLNSKLFLCAVYSLEGAVGKYYQSDLSPLYEPTVPDRRPRRRRRSRRLPQTS
jgi:hypothetical protein